MSVVEIEKDEIVELARAINNLSKEPLFESYFFSENELLRRSALGIRTPLAEEIEEFFNRCFIANQLAFHYQYSKQDEKAFQIERISSADFKMLKRGHLNLTQIRERLGSLRYNLYTNAGRCFLCREDIERLESLEHFVIALMVKLFE